MLPQRTRDAESRVKNKLSNGPRRAQSNVFLGNIINTEYSVTWRHTSVVRDMLVSCERARECTRECKVAPRIKCFIRPWQMYCILSGAFFIVGMNEFFKSD